MKTKYLEHILFEPLKKATDEQVAFLGNAIFFNQAFLEKNIRNYWRSFQKITRQFLQAKDLKDGFIVLGVIFIILVSQTMILHLMNLSLEQRERCLTMHVKNMKNIYQQAPREI